MVQVTFRIPICPLTLRPGVFGVYPGIVSIAAGGGGVVVQVNAVTGVHAGHAVVFIIQHGKHVIPGIGIAPYGIRGVIFAQTVQQGLTVHAGKKNFLRAQGRGLSNDKCIKQKQGNHPSQSLHGVSPLVCVSRYSLP